jgi:PAS domain S-box-containing protein
MKKPVRILIVEDKSDDVALAKHEIRKVLTEFEFLVVETRERFIQALEIFQPDVILSEYILPQFDGMKALKLTLYHAPSIPFIIWTGSISEDVAVDCVKAGANNYVLKDNVKRLGPAIFRALEEKELLTARRQAEQKYQSIFENSMEGIFQSSPEGRYLNVNPTMARLYGYESPAEMIESVKSIADQIYVNPAERAEFIKLLHTQNTVERYEKRNYRKDRSVIWTSTSARAVRDENGNLLYYEGFIQDITERKEAEEALQRSEQRFRALIENGLDDISLLAADGSLLWESPSTIRNLGYTPGEFVGRNIFEMMHPEDFEWTQEAFANLLQEPESRQRGIFRLRRADETWRWVEAIATNLLGDPSVNAIVINYRDITEHKQAQEALQENQTKYQNLVETSHDLIWTIDAEGRFTFVNRAARDIYGYEPEELIGKSFFEVLDTQHYGPQDFEKFHEMIEKDNALHGFETYVRHRDGRQVILSTNSIPLRAEHGNFMGVAGSSHDITIRKKVEDVFREERNLLRTLIDNLPDRIYAMDTQGRKTLSNIADWKASGRKTMEDVIGKTDFDLYPAELAEEYWKLDQAVLRSGQPVINHEERGLDPDGHLVSVLTSKIPLRDDVGNVVGLVGIGHDITERKQTEEKLRRSETRYRLVTKATNDVIWEWDPKTDQLLWSENAQYVFGYSIEEIGPDEKWWDERIHPDDRTPVLTKLDALIAGSESIWEEEYRFLLKDGSYAHISDKGYIERDETSAAIRMIGAMSNITFRKEAEIERQALLEIMQGFANTKDLQALLKLIHDSIAKVIYAKNFFVILYQPTTGFFEEIYSVDQYDPPAAPARLEDSITSYVFRSGEPLLLTQSSFGELAAQGKMKLVGTDSASWLGVPLKTSGKTIGVMAVQDYENDDRYSEHDRDFLASIASQVALAIERKRSEAAEHEQRILAESLRDTAETLNRTLDYREVLDHILTTMGRVVPHDAGSILLIEGEFAQVVRSHGYDKHGSSNDEITGINLPLANTTNLRRMLETKQPEVIYDTYTYSGWQSVHTTDWLRSSVGAPILIYGEVIGFICLDSQATEYFTPVHAERLEAFANQAALAIQNARLLQQAQEEIAERKRAEEALRESEEHYRTIFEGVQDAIFVESLDGKIQMVNQRACEMFGYSQSEFLTKTVADLVPAGHSILGTDGAADSLSAEPRQSVNRRANGETFPIEVSGQVQIINGEKVLLVVVRDITERKRAEELLMESEKRFSSAFEYASIGMALVTTEGRWARVNRALSGLLGYSETEFLEKSFQDITHPDDLQSDLNYVNQLLTGELDSYQMEKRYFHKSGHIVWALLSVSLVRDDRGKPQHFISQIQDITARKESELALLKSQSRYRDLFDSSPVSIWEEDFSLVKQKIDALLDIGITDLKEYFASHPGKATELASLVKVTDANQASLDLYHVERKEDLLKGLPETMGGDALEHFQEEILGLLNTPNRFMWEGTETMLDGRQMEVVVTGSIPQGFEEDWSKVIVSISDITQRKRSELEIRRHIAELEAVYDNGLSVGRLLDPSEIGNRLIKTFARYLPWHHVTIRLRKEHSDNLELVAFNLPNLREEEKTDAGQHFIARINKVGQGLSGWVIQTGNALRTGNVHSHPQYIDTHAGIQSGLYVPLKIGERVIGVISVESELPDAFTEQDERLLATLANQTAIAFENARLYEAMQKELLERKRVEEALRVSETHYRALADSITDILFELDQDLHYIHWNKASEAITGIPAGEAIGKSMEEILGVSSEQTRIRAIYENVLRTQQSSTFEITLDFHGEKRSFETTAYPSLRGVSVVAKDVTDRKRAETIMQKRFEMMEYSAKHSLNELMLRMVDEVSELTGSSIGFFHFMEEDQVRLRIQTWSTSALHLFQMAPEEGTHLPLDRAGVWADAIRQRRPFIHNDYEALENKKGLPQGHVPVVREIVIPIIRNEQIMAVMGIANKLQEYTSQDLELATRLADYAWDITERKQMEIALQMERNQLVQRVEERTADLSRANSNLARALRVKDEFLANMSHELRTPLNAILGLSESLAEQIAGPLNEKQQKYISTISESGHHLLSLINDILDLAKIDAGQITLDINKVDILAVCQASLRMVKQLAQKKNQEVSLQIDPGLGLMWADERRLKQMMVNLLGNAVKFTPEYGKLGLEVHGNEEANQVTITVWDNGIGIKPLDLARLFQPFVQLDSGLAREATGTGLGLALVAQMARLHGGSVSASSEAGKGSRFTISLPWEPALAIDPASRMRITGKFRAVQFNEENQPTILLVEDTKEVVMMLKDYLELASYKVFTAQDGIDGIVQARHVKPDLILMDVQMPGMDGFETARKLRSDPDFRNTPIIALTALAMPHDRERCLEAGMDEYMSKPVNLKALVKLIQSFLSEREARVP